MNFHHEIELLLPTKGARWTALLTSLLLTPAFQAPAFLMPFLWPTATDKYLILLQIITTTLVLLVGSLITLYLIIRAYNEQSKQHALELQKQLAHFESLAEAERVKRVAKPINISNKHIV